MTPCPYCGRQPELVTGISVYPHRFDLRRRLFWKCEPCEAWVGCHGRAGAVPLGRLANAELRAAKAKAHAAFDPLWRDRRMTRAAAYRWLSDALGIPKARCHIGWFDVAQCEAVVEACAAAEVA